MSSIPYDARSSYSAVTRHTPTFGRFQDSETDEAWINEDVLWFDGQADGPYLGELRFE